MPLLPFVGPTYSLDSHVASVQRTVNMVPVPLEPRNERTEWVFKDVPGLTVFSEPTIPATLRYFEVQITAEGSSSGYQDYALMGITYGDSSGRPVTSGGVLTDVLEWGVTVAGNSWRAGVSDEVYINKAGEDGPSWPTPKTIRFLVDTANGNLYVGKEAKWLRPTMQTAVTTDDPIGAGIAPLFDDVTTTKNLTIYMIYNPLLLAVPSGVCSVTFRTTADEFLFPVPPDAVPWKETGLPMQFTAGGLWSPASGTSFALNANITESSPALHASQSVIV